MVRARLWSPALAFPAFCASAASAQLPQLSLIDLAQRSFDAKQYGKAFEQASAALKLKPNSSRAIYLVGISACRIAGKRDVGRAKLDQYLNGFQLTSIQRTNALFARQNCNDLPLAGTASGGFGLPSSGSGSHGTSTPAPRTAQAVAARATIQIPGRTGPQAAARRIQIQKEAIDAPGSLRGVTRMGHYTVETG
jgi:hypothetical protein